MTLLYKALRLQVIYKSYNPFYIVELCKYNSNVSILSSIIYRELFKYSLLTDNIFIEEFHYTFYIFLLKGPNFHLFKYIFLYNSQVLEFKTGWRHKYNIHYYLLPQGRLLYKIYCFFFLSQLLFLIL